MATNKQTTKASIHLLVFLTDNCDAPSFGHLDHFVHHALRPFGKVVPLKHPDWAVPHNLLGPAHHLCIGLNALWSTVQTLQRREKTSLPIIKIIKLELDTDENK